MPDLDYISQMLMNEYNNPSPANDYISSATANINNLTRSRVRNQNSKFATTGMNRSGIAGAAANDIYSNAGEQMSQVAATGEQMRAQEREASIGKLLGIAEYEDQKPTFMNYLGSILGTATGTGLGALEGGLVNNLLKPKVNSNNNTISTMMSSPTQNSNSYLGGNPYQIMGNY